MEDEYEISNEHKQNINRRAAGPDLSLEMKNSSKSVGEHVEDRDASVLLSG